MAWTSPMTASSGAVFTAAQFNTNVRDNLNQTSASLVTQAGQIIVSTAANALAARTVTQAYVATAENTTSTSYTDLTTVGPQVTVTCAAQAIVGISTNVGASLGFAALMSFAVSGASTVAASNSTCIGPWGGAVNGMTWRLGGIFLVTGLTAGSNTFTAKYFSGNATSTASYGDRRIFVIPL